MRNAIIYAIHFAFVAATALIAYKTEFVSWWVICLILSPMILATGSRLTNKSGQEGEDSASKVRTKRSLRDYSYTINARILFPISVGLFFVSLYHYFPTLMENDAANVLSVYGITNPGGSDPLLNQTFFEVNDLFKDAVTVLYAICVAFLLLKGLSDYDELKQILYSEANEVRTISDFATYFLDSERPNENFPIILKLRRLLCDYLGNMLAGNKVRTAPENEHVLEDCIIAVGKLKTLDTNDKIALEEIMKGLSTISEMRANRTVCIEKRMSPFILVLVFMMSLTIVLSFFGSASKEVSIDYIYVFLLPTFYTSIFMTLIDLSSPFDGYWQIKLHAIEGVRAKLSKQIKDMQEAQVSSAPDQPA